MALFGFVTSFPSYVSISPIVRIYILQHLAEKQFLRVRGPEHNDTCCVFPRCRCKKACGRGVPSRTIPLHLLTCCSLTGRAASLYRPLYSFSCGLISHFKPGCTSTINSHFGLGWCIFISILPLLFLHRSGDQKLLTHECHTQWHSTIRCSR